MGWGLGKRKSPELKGSEKNEKESQLGYKKRKKNKNKGESLHIPKSLTSSPIIVT